MSFELEKIAKAIGGNGNGFEMERIAENVNGGGSGSGSASGGVRIVHVDAGEDTMVLDIKPDDIFDENNELIVVPIVYINIPSEIPGHLAPANNAYYSDEYGYFLYFDSDLFIAPSRDNYFTISENDNGPRL